MLNLEQIKQERCYEFKTEAGFSNIKEVVRILNVDHPTLPKDILFSLHVKNFEVRADYVWVDSGDYVRVYSTILKDGVVVNRGLYPFEIEEDTTLEDIEDQLFIELENYFDEMDEDEEMA